MAGGSVVDAPHRRVTLAEVRAHREEIYRLAAKRGVVSVRVFGSVARDEADDDSDLDLLVEVAPGTGTVADAAHFIQYLRNSQHHPSPFATNREPAA